MRAVGYYNGEAGDLQDMRIPMQDRAMFFGDGVYDFVFGYNGILFALEDHIDRFYHSMELMQIRPYCDREKLQEEIRRCMDLAGLQEGEGFQLYLQSSRGNCPRNHIFPKEGVPSTLLMTVKPFKDPNFRDPLKLVTVEDTRFFHCNIKTLNLIPNVMAAEKAEEAGCQEAVFHRGDNVTECAHSALVILKDGVLIAPPLNELILPSISRAHVMDICREEGIPTDIRTFTLAELMDADEIIVLSTSKLIARADTVDGMPAGMKDGNTFGRIRQKYFDRVRQETGYTLG